MWKGYVEGDLCCFVALVKNRINLYQLILVLGKITGILEMT